MRKSSQFNDYSVYLIHTLFYIPWLQRTGLSIVTELFPVAGVICMCGNIEGEAEVY